MQDKPYLDLKTSLERLSRDLPQLERELGLEPTPGAQAWRARLLRHVLPTLSFDLPVLLVAICGGGSTGKSSLFNALAGQAFSGVGFRAGLTQRVLLVGHPEVLREASTAEALLQRMPQAPVAWRQADDTQQPGPPLFATSPSVPRNLLLLDTPDFDTGQDGELVNRALAEQVLRTAEVMVYVFTNTVYNNLSNAHFMAEIVGGLGGRPTILVYRISRAASDEEVLEHCRVVAENLYPDGAASKRGWPESIVGVYRVHESDRIALGKASPKLLPIGPTRAPIDKLLAGLDVAKIKRQVLDDDLRVIQVGADDDLRRVRQGARSMTLYRAGLDHVLAEQALLSLRAFPANEAVTLTTRLFLETSPPAVRLLRRTGQVISAPLKGALAVAKRLVGDDDLATRAAPPDPVAALEADMLSSANVLRNRLLDDHLIVQVASGDALLELARQALTERTPSDGDDAAVQIESVGRGQYNVHIPSPALVKEQEATLLAQDWTETARQLRALAPQLVGLPEGIRAELKEQIRTFRGEMGWQQRLRETLFASLTALPPLLGVTYTLMTADPVSGGGLLIHLSSLFGLNDLWALVSLPASLGLSQQERKQLEQMLQPVMQLWLERRAGRLVQALAETVCAPILALSDGPSESALASLDRAIAVLGERQTL